MRSRKDLSISHHQINPSTVSKFDKSIIQQVAAATGKDPEHVERILKYFFSTTGFWHYVNKQFRVRLFKLFETLIDERGKKLLDMKRAKVMAAESERNKTGNAKRYMDQKFQKIDKEDEFFSTKDLLF